MPTNPSQIDIRATLLSQLNLFDTPTLEKLVTIGNSILSPMNSELTSVDFSAMVNQVLKPGGLADRYFPEWTDRSASDFGRFLVEIFALYSDKDFFYINHYSREGFIGVAELYRSIYHRALHQGFKPTSNVSATGDVQLIFSSGVDEFVPRGSIVLGVQEFPDLVYTNEEFTIPASSIDQEITTTFVHGTLQRQQQFFDGFSIMIDTPRVVSKSIKLTIDGEVWTEVDSFINGVSSTKHFIVVYDESGRAEILFATGGMGAIPTENIICDIEFLTGGGYGGDILANTINRVSVSQTTRNLTSYTQYEIKGGNDLMPLEKLRQVVIGKARHQNRAVTPEDVRYLCSELSFVKKVSSDCILNYLYVYIMPTAGGNISPSQKNLVEEKLEDMLLMGYNVTVTSPIYVPVVLEVDLYLLPKTIKNGAYVVAQQTINEYLDPMKNGEFGQGVNRSQLSLLLLQRVTGLQNVVYKKLYRGGLSSIPGMDLVSDVVFDEQEMVNMGTTSIVINMHGGI